MMTVIPFDLTDEEKAQKKDLAQQVLDKVKASDAWQTQTWMHWQKK